MMRRGCDSIGVYGLLGNYMITAVGAGKVSLRRVTIVGYWRLRYWVFET